MIKWQVCFTIFVGTGGEYIDVVKDYSVFDNNLFMVQSIYTIESFFYIRFIKNRF